jgi:catechol 2,3-dioxygenase-like lactoylglutathione lyase family enzyme
MFHPATGNRPASARLSINREKGASMEAQTLYRGRLIDHIHLVVADIAASRRFYAALLDVLGIAIGGSEPDYFWADELFVSTADSEAALGRLTGRHHLAFQARDRAMVDRFHAAGLAAGGRDNGAPGVRPYHPGYYAAFLIDPDGNNIEAVFHGPADRSAESIEICFEA